MGHVLGLVNLEFTNCYSACSDSGEDSFYKCDGAKNEYAALLGLVFQAEEGDLKVDTASCGHWDETSFSATSLSSELMTPIFEIDKAQPLTRVSIAALAEATTDYVVDYSTANDYLVTVNRTMANRNDEFYQPFVAESSFDLSTSMIALPLPISYNGE